MGSTNTKFAYTAGVSALAGIIIFVFFGPDVKKNRNEKRLEVRGLPNMGSTCYVSAVLQALASCNHFKHWLLYCYKRFNREKGPSLTQSKSHLFPLVASLHSAVLYVNRQEINRNDNQLATNNPQINILRILSSMKLSRDREEDTLELFQHIMTALQEESAKIVQGSTINVPNSESNNASAAVSQDEEEDHDDVENNGNFVVVDGGGDVDLPSRFVDENTFSKPLTRLQMKNLNTLTKNLHISHRLGYYHSIKKIFPLNPFFGTTASKLKCLTCLTERSSWTIEKYHSLSLHLPSKRSTQVLSILDLVNNFFRTVIVHEVECSVCTKNKNGVKTKSSFSKVTVVAKLPRSLCFQILRTAWSSTGSTKIYDFVTFSEILDLSEIPRLKGVMLDEFKHKLKSDAIGDSAHTREETVNVISHVNNSLLYRLCAVISHSGAAESGHFVTFRRGPIDNDKWFLASDEDVCEVPIMSILNSNAYMLFYELIKPENHPNL